jgi:hypothetical protein
VNKLTLIVGLVGLTALTLGGCSKSSKPGTEVPGGTIPANGSSYIVLAWNDLGMHCLNPNYDQAVVLPPYNTVWAQVVKRGNPPQIVTEGLTVEYRIIGNTHSYGKGLASRGENFSQFWDNAQALFGTALARDTGLNLEDPAIHNGLSGTMVMKGDHFQVNGMPVTPINDSDVWSPYQVIEVTVKNAGVTVAQTLATVPTSDELNCGKSGCHAAANPFADVLAKHDQLHGTSLASHTPVLCANGSCHTSPALGQTGAGANGYLSHAIHGAHANRNAACTDCHPGAVTQCNRSLAHTAQDGNCVTCHGSMAQVASSIEGGRVPWVTEPKCVTCHTGVQEVDTGAALYRNASGHDGIRCPACHGSPHAMYPSRVASDNYQPLQYQAKAMTIGSCGVCHESSRGEGAGGEFNETHGGNGRPNSCRVCHTVVSGDSARWPHAYTWKAR